jgi:hypothetical protein
MSLAKLGFRRMNEATKVATARNIVAKTTGNPDFPNPTPTLAAITAAANDVETAAAAAAGGGKKLKTIMDAKIVILEKLISAFISYVNSVSGGDAAKILSTGLGVKNQTKRKPKTLNATPGPKPGDVIVEGPSNKARSNKWQYGYDPNFNTAAAPSAAPPANIVWIDADDTTTAKTLLQNLKSGNRVWVRHAPVNTKAKGGQGPWSDPVSVIVP